MRKELIAILAFFLVAAIGGYATSETVNPASNVTADSDATAGTVLYRNSSNATTVNTFTAATLTVTSGATLPAGDIVTADLADGAVTSPKVAENTITSGKIIDLQVTSADLAANSVNTEKIVNLTVTSADLAANSVDSEKIYAGSVLEASIGASAVSTTKVEDTAITTPKLLFAGSWSSGKIVCIRDDSAFGLCTQTSQSDGTCNCE